MSKINLPSLVNDLGIATKVDSLNTLLNQSPPKQWLASHKGVQYQPIDRVKSNLVKIFQDYDWSIKDVRVVANSILIFGTLSVTNPITGKVRNVDGVGAWPIQLKSGSNPMQIENIVQDAIQKNAPAAESLALKNAAAKLGNLFGDGVKDVEFKGVYSVDIESQEDVEQIKQSVK